MAIAQSKSADKGGKKKGGRPKKELSEKLVSITMHVTPEDFMWLHMGAEQVGMPLSEFAREMVQLRARRQLRRLRVPLTPAQEQLATRLAEACNCLTRLEQLAQESGYAAAAVEVGATGQELAHFLTQLARA